MLRIFVAWIEPTRDFQLRPRAREEHEKRDSAEGRNDGTNAKVDECNRRASEVLGDAIMAAFILTEKIDGVT